MSTEHLDAGPDAGATEHVDPLDSIISAAVDQAFAEPHEGAEATPPAASGQNRDASGRYSRPAEPSAQEPARADADPAQPTGEQPAAPAALQAPARWTDADKAAFGQLPPEGQKLLSEVHGRLEADYTRKTQELADHRRQIEPFVGTLGQHTDFLNGMSQQIRQAPAQIVGDVLQLYRVLATGAPHEKAQALGWVAQNVAGVDLRSIVGGQQGGGQQAITAPDPILHDLRQQLAQTQRTVQSFEADRQQQHASEANRTLQDFATAKDAQGQPKYPHFEAVKAMMVPHVLAGVPLEQAYAHAAKPITDALAARDAATQAADKARADAVARARKAGSPRSFGSAPNGAAKPTGLDAIVAAAVDGAYGG